MHKENRVLLEHLFKSDFYEVKNWMCDLSPETAPGKGYNDCFCLVFVRTGELHFNLQQQAYDMHTGHILIDKPDYEYRMRPATGQYTIFNFTHDFYADLLEDLNLKQAFFFSNPNLLSMMLKVSPEVEYLHHQVMRHITSDKMTMDLLVVELVRTIAQTLAQSGDHEPATPGLKKFHLPVVEKAKEFILQHFHTDFSLFELARHACTSPFHFSRIFKQYTAVSPHQFLQNVRLKHSEVLLRSSPAPIADIAFQCGYNNADYFATAFKQKYGLSPSAFKQRQPA